MNSVNYNEVYKQITKNIKYKKPKLLLHSCCGPCSTAVLEKISDYFKIYVLFYNPNIYPKSEYIKRKNEQIRLLKILDIQMIDCDYDTKTYETVVKGYENEKEGFKRCECCIEHRMRKTALFAKENDFDYFGTTLTVSPHKNSEFINMIGGKLEMDYGIKYLYSDFKKENGYLRSIELSKQYDLYRQNYCGCVYSMRGKEKNE